MILGRRLASIAICLLVLNVAAGPQAAQSQSKEKRLQKSAQPADIDRNGVLILTRSALMALDQANKTGNYSVLRDLGSPTFQVNNPSQLADIFANQRKQGLDFGAIAVLEPQLTLLPQIEPKGMLHMAGFFPSVPFQVNFELMFEPVNGQWKIFGISVNLTAAGPKAPLGAAVDQPEPAKGPPPRNPSLAVNPKKEN